MRTLRKTPAGRRPTSCSVRQPPSAVPGTLAVVLTGMGKDGTRGCERIVQAGGHVLVQDEATSVVWGMPGQVAEAGLADEILPLDRLGDAIRRRIGARRDRPGSTPRKGS